MQKGIRKKYIIIKRQFILVIAVILFFTSCKKDTICNDPTNQKCNNYDPCYQKTEANASFNIYENIGGTGIEADTIWCDNYVNIKAENKTNCTYNWKVKAPGFYYTNADSSFALNATIQSLPIAKMYTVTLIITKLNGDCSNVKSIDSLTKYFYIWPKEYIGNYTNINYLPVFGTYAGYKKSNPTQLVYVTVFDSIYSAPNLPCNGNAAGKIEQFNIIRNLAYNNFSSENYGKAYNSTIYRKGCSGFILADGTSISYGLAGCYSSKYLVDFVGTGWLDYNNQKKININYQYKDTISYLWVSDFFTGIKVN